MKITKGVHKILLGSCFYIQGQPAEVPKDLQSAAVSAFGKLVTLHDNGKIFAGEDEVEFTPSEVVVLKYLYDMKKVWPFNAKETTDELHLIFYPPKVPENA